MPLRLKAYAKINLTLEVLGKRADGFHEIVGVLQTIDLWDELSFWPSSRVELEGDLTGDDNLVLQAAILLRDHYARGRGARIHLKKRIPLASGLGGGSSDAAATLLGLNQMWGLELSREALLPLASRLGSDVPFFLHGGTALVRGRGEVVEPLPPLTPRWLVVLCPPLELPRKTATVYARVSPSLYSFGEFTARLVQALKERGELPQDLLINALTGIALETFPGLEDYWRAFEKAGAEAVRLTGSGPALYSFTGYRRGREMVRRLREKGLKAHLCRTLGG